MQGFDTYFMWRHCLGDIEPLLDIWTANMDVQVFQVEHRISITGYFIICFHNVLKEKRTEASGTSLVNMLIL